MKSTKNNHRITVLLSLTILLLTNLLHAQRVELNDRRTLFSATYRNPDNTITTEISAAPLHYRHTDGKFKPIVRDFVPSDSDYDWEVTRGLYNVYLKSNLIGEWPVVFEGKDGANLKMKLTGFGYLDIVSKQFQLLQQVQSSEPVVSGHQVRFPEVFPNIDLKYLYQDLRLKEEILVSQTARDNLPAPEDFGIPTNNAYLVFATQLDLDGAPQVYAKNEKVRNKDFEGFEPITFRNIKGDIKFFLPVDWAFRELDRDTLNAEIMLKIHKRLIHPTEGHFLLAGVKLQDLKKMPRGTVVFDPQVEVIQPGAAAGYDNLIYYKNYYPVRSTYNYGVYDKLQIVRTNYTAYDLQRSLLKFDLSVIPATATIDTATLDLNCNYVHTRNIYPAFIEVHKLLTPWTEGSQIGTAGESNWNAATSSTNWSSAGGDYDANVVSSYQITGSAVLNQWLNWDVQSLVQEWVGGSAANNGLILKLLSESSGYKYYRFHSSDSSSDTLRPKLTITYTDAGYKTTYYIRDAGGQVIATYEK